METKNNGVVLLPKTVLLHWNHLLSTVVVDGEDGIGLKLDNISQFFQVLKLSWRSILCTSKGTDQWF